MRRELNWKIITEKYLFSLFTEHHSDDLKCHKAGLTPPSTHLSWRVLLRGWVGVQDQHPPQHGWEACGCILMRGGGAEWKSRQSDVEEERERVGVKKKNRKENGRGSSCYQVHFQSSLCCLLSHNAHTSTHTHVFTGLVWWGTSTGQQRDAQGGGSHTAARTASHITGVQCQGHWTPFSHLLGIKASVRLEVTVTEALIARVGKPEQLLFKIIIIISYQRD